MVGKMTAKRILYIGGTGTISAACVRRSLELGDDVTVLNRGTGRRPLPEGVRLLSADVRDAEAVASVVGAAEFDAVADFLSFTPEHVTAALTQFEGRSGHYVFISSASAYQKPPARVPVTESTPLRNPYWQYSRDKIACEDLLVAAYRDRGLPATIVRPSHTYDEQTFPNMGGWTDILRMRAGKPVIIHGDGTTQWTLTHSDDFAVAFAGLLAAPVAIGEAFHITGDHAPTWNQIYGWLADAAGVRDPEFVHVASDTIAAASPELGSGLLGDKAHSMVFDNSKVKAVVPDFRTTITFDEGARRILTHADTDPAAQRADPDFDALSDRLAAHAAGIAEG